MQKDMKCFQATLAILVFIVAHMDATLVQAATSKASITLSVTIESSSRLTLNENSKHGDIGATANVRDGSTPAVLTVTAGKDPLNPTLGATATASDKRGNLFLTAPATPTETVPSAVAGQACTGSYSETFDWYMAKSWNCDPGRNSVTVIYTLASP